MSAVFAANSADAQNTRSTSSRTTSLHGLPGLIDVPTAEVASDGLFSLNFSKMGPTTRTTLAFQITPRLSGAFRYTGVEGFDPRIDPYYDRSFDVRYRVFDETQYLPAVSVGINDIIGTGVFASEYVVATKSIGDNLRVTAGVGWGRLGSYGAIGTPFGERPPIVVGKGGMPNYRQWFRGPAAPFGGISYAFNDKLTFKAEYSSDAYLQEEAAGIFTVESPFSFGADYQIRPGISVGAYYMYGSTIGFQVNVAADPYKPVAPSGTEEAPLPVLPRPARNVNASEWQTAWTTDPEMQPAIRDALAKALADDGQRLEAMSVSATRAEVRITNNRYGASAQAVGRAARMMSRAFPATVETFVITQMRNGIPLSSVTISRSDIESHEHLPASMLYDRVQITDADLNDETLEQTPGLYPNFRWSLGPYAKISIFDPDNPVRADFGVRLSGEYVVSPGLVFSGAITKKLIGNLDSTTRFSDSVLPHVRSDISEYAIHGDPAIEHLTLAWYARPGRNLYSRVTVGYLEPMFAGVSGEVLWKPVDSRFALGAEVAYVVQRDYDQLFGLQDYSVVTGHVSAYYDLGNGFTTQLDVGRYLAGDYGATLSVDRVFSNGWKVGAYATLTNVSAEEFGEGSFDKGIRISIPIEWALGSPTRTKSTTAIRSLARDGGARLEVDGRLFEWVDEGHGDALTERWGRFWR